MCVRACVGALLRTTHPLVFGFNCRAIWRVDERAVHKNWGDEWFVARFLFVCLFVGGLVLIAIFAAQTCSGW